MTVMVNGQKNSWKVCWRNTLHFVHYLNILFEKRGKKKKKCFFCRKKTHKNWSGGWQEEEGEGKKKREREKSENLSKVSSVVVVWGFSTFLLSCFLFEFLFEKEKQNKTRSFFSSFFSSKTVDKSKNRKV